MADEADDSCRDPSCSSCAELKEALEASKRQHSLTLRTVKEKIMSTDELIKKYQQKCRESDKHLQQVLDFTLKLEAAQVKIEALQGQLDRSMHSTEPLRKNAARLLREKSLADSTISELRGNVQRLETLNSELMDTAKLKDEQECAWRLEKQVQAHEVQKQKKSLEKSEATISKLQEQLKKEKDQNKDLTKSLTQANRKITKLQQQLEKSEEEVESAKLDAELALDYSISGTKQASKPRQKRKTAQPTQAPEATNQSSSPISYSNQHVAHIMRELRELSDIGPTLSPLPPSPDRGAPGSSSSEGSVSESEDDGEASDDGDSDSSLGDLADMIIGDNGEPGEFVASPARTADDSLVGDEDFDNKGSKDFVKNNGKADDGKTEPEESLTEQTSIVSVDTPVDDEEIEIKNLKDSAKNSSNPDNRQTEHEEPLAEKTPDKLKGSENIPLSNCEVKCNSKNETSEDKNGLKQGDTVHLMGKNSHDTERRSSDNARVNKKDIKASKTVESSNASEFSSPLRKGKRQVTSPKPRVMTRSRSKAMKLSSSSEADSASEKETGSDLISSRDTELGSDGVARKVKKLQVGDSENKRRKVECDQQVHSSDAEGVSHRNTDEFGYPADSISSLHVNVTNENNSNAFSEEVDRVVINSDNQNENNKVDKLDAENEEKLCSSSESGNESSVPVIMLTEPRDNSGEIASSDHNIHNNDSVKARPINDVKNVATNIADEQTLPSGKNDSSVSENILQNKETVSEQKEANLEENNNEILKLFEDVPDQLELVSASVLDTNSSDKTELPLRETRDVCSSTTERKTAGVSVSISCECDENSLPEKMRSLSEKETKVDSESSEVFARDLLNSSVKSTKCENTRVRMLSGESDVNRDLTTTTAMSTRSSLEKPKDEGSEHSNLQLPKEFGTHSSSMANGEAPIVDSSTMADDLNIVKYKDGNSGDSDLDTREDVPSNSFLPETPVVGSSALKVDDDRDVIMASSSTSTRSLAEKCKDGSSEESNLALTEYAISLHTSDDLTQGYSIKDAAAELSNVDNFISQEGTFEIEAEHSINHKENTRNDFEGDVLSVISQEVEQPSSSNGKRKRSIVEGSIPTFRAAIDESVSSSCFLDAESALDENKPLQPSLSSDKTDTLASTPVNLAQQDTLPIQALMRNLGDLIGDQFHTLSPLPPSPNPSDDEDEASPIGDLNIGDFPPLSPLPPSPCSLAGEVYPASLSSTRDYNKQTQKGPSNTTTASRTSHSPKECHATVNYAEFSSKNVKRTLLGGGTTCDIRRRDDRDSLVKNLSAGSIMSTFRSTPAGESKSLKRPLQQPVSESAKDRNLVSQCKKMKTQLNVNQRQESTALCKDGKTSSSVISVTSHGNVGSGEPMMAKQPANSGTSDKPVRAKQLKQQTKNTGANEAGMNANISTKTAERKDCKYRSLSVRPKSQSEKNYAYKCLTRLHEDSVELNVVVQRFSTKKSISSCTPLTSAIVQFLKAREDDIMPLILDQLEQYQSDEELQEWKPVKSGFETRLLEVVTQLSRGDEKFGNLIPQLVALCSRSLITACHSSTDGDINGALSLCRVFTAVCRLKEDLGCVRVVCYDVMRSLHRLQNKALELVVAMVTVWPEILRSSPSYMSDEQLSLARTLLVVLLNWADSFSNVLGNIPRTLYSWGSDPVTDETVKDLGLGLMKRLQDESFTNVCIDEDGNLVADRHSFELVKSLQLLSCVLGWEWTVNNLIVDNIWRILETWAGGVQVVSNDEMDCSRDVTAPTTALSGIVKADENSLTSGKSTCCCQTSRDETVSRNLPRVGVTEDKETREHAEQMGGEERREICSRCGKLTQGRLAESQIVVCIQLLGVLCRIAIENKQTAVPEITDVLCGLIDQTFNSKATYAIQLAAAVSLLDLSPWQPERVATALSKWLAGVKESCSLQPPACVTQGLLCLKSMMSNQAEKGAVTLS